MTVNGFQKMTLLDFPGKVACTIFLGGCNMRCPFCHNAGLVLGDGTATFSGEEIISYLEKRKGILDGVCITGGEPTLRRDLPEFIREIKNLGYTVKLDTNGTNPALLKSLILDGLVDYVAMDIKNCFEKYPQTVGVDNFDITPIKESIDFLLSGAVDFEFRTTVVKQLHTVEDIERIAKEISPAKKYFIQNFVDSGNLIGQGLCAHDEQTLKEMLAAAQKQIPGAALRGV